MAYRRRAQIARALDSLGGRTHGFTTTLRLTMERRRASRALCADALVCSGVLYHRTWRGATSEFRGSGIRLGLDSQGKLSPGESCHSERLRSERAFRFTMVRCVSSGPGSEKPGQEKKAIAAGTLQPANLAPTLGGAREGAQRRT
jgi:hypothetical protein